MPRQSDAPKNVSAFGEARGEVVVGKMPRGYAWLAATVILFGIVSGVGLYTSPRNPNVSAFYALAVIIVICGSISALGVLFGWWLMRSCVIADKDGLRWRGMGKWKSATWMQVRDYYIKRLPKGGESYLVETEAGQLDLKDLSQGALLRQTVQEKARWAKASTWEERDAKQPSLELTDEETFTTNTDEREFWILLCIVTFVLPLLMLFKANTTLSAPAMLYSTIRQTWQTMGALWALGLIFMFAFPGLMYGLIIFARWPPVREGKKRCGQSVTVSPYGIMWRDASTQREVKARWEEVDDFYIGEIPGWVRLDQRYVVETRRGNFDFVAVQNTARLRALIQKYCARHSVNQPWQSRNEHKEITSPDGAQTFSYRDSPIRAMLYFFTFLAVMTWFTGIAHYTGFIVVRNQSPHNFGDLLFGLFFGGSLTALSIWLWQQYFCFQIRADHNGLAQRCGRKQRFIAWPDVQEYEDVSGWGIVRSKTETIRFYVAIGRCSELQKIIKERTVNSRTKSW